MKLWIVLLAALLTATMSASLAHADYAFVFTDTSGNAMSTFSVNAGQSITIDVYLAQTGSSTGLTNQGLNSAGVQLNTQTPSVATVTGVTANAAFDQSSTTTGASASVTEHQTFSPAVTAPTSGPTAGMILVGAFTFTGQSAGSTATVTAIPSTGTGVNVLGDGTVIDGMIANATAVITVTAVPEPGSMLLVGLAVSSFGVGVLRRRLRRQPTQPAAAAM